MCHVTLVTCDYLLHASPVLINIAKGELCLSLSPEHALVVQSEMTMYPLRLSGGGAFVIPLELGGRRSP